MQTNILVLDPIDFSNDSDTVWHDFCVECAGDAPHGDSHCEGCGSY